MDEIDRSLLTDEPVSVPPRLAANVLAEIRALSRPAPRFPWQQFSVKAALSAGLASAAAIVFTSVDAAIFVPVAPEVFGAGLIVVSTLVGFLLPRTLREIRD